MPSSHPRPTIALSIAVILALSLIAFPSNAAAATTVRFPSNTAHNTFDDPHEFNRLAYVTNYTYDANGNRQSEGGF